ncbi:MAG: hypothetical protein JWO85_1207 [Candidatus Eremiobacteraeota bacterium]|nr:hypothetical protein [Candidatus Eremiobacteraeota bacterium]
MTTTNFGTVPDPSRAVSALLARRTAALHARSAAVLTDLENGQPVGTAYIEGDDSADAAFRLLRVNGSDLPMGDEFAFTLAWEYALAHCAALGMPVADRAAAEGIALASAEATRDRFREQAVTNLRERAEAHPSGFAIPDRPSDLLALVAVDEPDTDDDTDDDDLPADLPAMEAKGNDVADCAAEAEARAAYFEARAAEGRARIARMGELQGEAE